MNEFQNCSLELHQDEDLNSIPQDEEHGDLVDGTLFPDHSRVDDQIFDYYQNVARASFDDMVLDDERNQLFYKAIKKSIQKLRKERKLDNVFVLDIGSGTGLLSMMAIQAGADRALACEQFKPIANCSEEIIEKNNMSKNIKVVNKFSSALNISEEIGGDGGMKPNLLVAELLDTEMIGEGCLSIYRDAVKRLTNPDTLFVPNKGRVWIQLVQSDKLFDCHQYRKSFEIAEDIQIKTPDCVRSCFGSHLLHDLQMNRLKPNEDFQILSEPIIAFEFEFKIDSLKTGIEFNRLKIHLKQTFHQPIMVFSWWDIDLDEDGQINLSCAPYWARDDFNAGDQQLAWREHWLQTIYYLPAFAFDKKNQVDGLSHDQINQDRTLYLDVFHDEFSFWFDLPDQTQPDQKPTPEEYQFFESWFCRCGLHSSFSRPRMYWMNDLNRYQTYWSALDKLLQREPYSKMSKIRLLYSGVESILPLMCACHPKIETIFIMVKNQVSWRFFDRFRHGNLLIDSKVVICSRKSFQPCPKSYIHGYITDISSHDAEFLSPLIESFEQIKRISEYLHREHHFFLPNQIVLRCLLVETEHLWKCYSPVKMVQLDGVELDLNPYDRLIRQARQAVDRQIEPKYMWEYCCWPLMLQPIDLLKINLANYHTKIDNTVDAELDLIGPSKDRIDQVNPESVALVLWLDQYLLDDDSDQRQIVNGGFDGELSFDQQVQWNRHSGPQFVAFFEKNHWEEIRKMTKFCFKILLNHGRLKFKN